MPFDELLIHQSLKINLASYPISSLHKKPIAMQLINTVVAFIALCSPVALAADAVIFGHPNSNSCGGKRWKRNFNAPGSACYNRNLLSIRWDE